MRCPKCGERERAKGQRWCRECRNAARRKVDTRTDTDGHVSIELKDTLGGVSIPIPKRVGVCGNCQVLADEVAMLKKQVAEANRRAEASRLAATDDQGGDAAGGLRARGMVRAVRPSAVDNDKQVTPHGPRCMCQWCQQQRRVAALEGA